MFKKNPFDQERMNPNFQQMPPQYMQAPQMMPMGPDFQQNRLQYEIMENRRRLNNLAKRVSRIESYLRIKDTPEYGYIEEDKPSQFSY